MKLADQIKNELLRCVNGTPSDIVLPNYFIGMYEADVVCIKTSGYCYEYEIKISRGDFKNDLKKGFKVGWLGGVSHSQNKHDALKNGELPANKFFFVVPDGLIEPGEVPTHAGLMYYKPDAGFWKDKFVCVKPAKWLHKNKFNDWENFARRLAHRHSIAKFELNRLRNTEFVEEIRKLTREIATLEKLLKRQDMEYLELKRSLT